MSHSHVEEADQEEARLYEELRCALEDVPREKEREQVMQRMIRQIKFGKWRKARLHEMKAYWIDAKPVKLWIWIAAGALAPVVFSAYLSGHPFGWSEVQDVIDEEVLIEHV